jgi:hypothetical protein
VDPAATTLKGSLRTTRAVLSEWNEHPLPVLLRWLLGALAAAVLLLFAVLVIAAISGGGGQPDLQQPPFQVGDLADVRQIVSRNLLVLLLHALACVAGFLAGTAVPLEADRRSGWSRRVHERAGRFAIGFVVAATLFSLAVQATTIGDDAARVARALHTSPALLLLSTLPHAVPELSALFLPLAAWIIASRHGGWDQLLAATAVTVALALPVLLACAAWEVYGAPHVIHALIGHG